MYHPIRMEIVELTISRLNEKGYGEGSFEGKEYWVLNALPGEIVEAREFKRKKGIRFAIAESIKKKSPHRTKELEEHYLSCSPWQIQTINEENNIKNELIRKFYSEEAEITLPEFEVFFAGEEYGYRNKLEFSFYGFHEGGLSLAYHKREGFKAKYTIDGCALAPEKVNRSNQKIISLLNEKKLEARQFKGILNRFSFSEQKAVSALYLKDETIPFEQNELDGLLDDDLQGLLVVYSNPKSPAFVETQILMCAGKTDVREQILDKTFIYPYDGFFQVNPSVFGQAAEDIIELAKEISDGKKLHIADIYSGIGTLGILVASIAEKVTCVEIFEKSKEYALKNIENNQINNIEFYQNKAESELEPIKTADIVIFDPPRSGLHPKVIKQIKESLPEHIIYLSCNPKTQAQNLRELKDIYEIKFFKAYNFYPHTPHVESLIQLVRKVSSKRI